MSLVPYANNNESYIADDDVFNTLPAVSGRLGKSFIPPVNIYETDTSVVVETPLAGVSPNDVEVSVEKDTLTIKGESMKEHVVEEKNYYRKEVRSGSFFRKVMLPVAVLENAVTAEFENGLLRITAPKTRSVEPKKIVHVKISKK